MSEEPVDWDAIPFGDPRHAQADAEEAEAEHLLPAERTTLIVARAMTGRGEGVPLNIALVLTMTIERLLRAAS